MEEYKNSSNSFLLEGNASYLVIIALDESDVVLR